MADNSLESTEETPVGRNPDGTFNSLNPTAFKKGVSGNPQGMSKGYKTLVNEAKMRQLIAGEKAHQFLERSLSDYDAVYGSTKITPPKEIHSIARTLMDFGLPKPAQTNEIEAVTPDSLDPSKMNEKDITLAAIAALERHKADMAIIEHLKATGKLQGVLDEMSTQPSTTTTIETAPVALLEALTPSESN